jgi:nucleoside-diphosphate-sugar epimerase
MNKNKFSLIYDLLCILIPSFLYISFVNIFLLLKITIFNILIILIFLLLNFYKKSTIFKIYKKLIIIFLVILCMSLGKYYFFGSSIFFNIIFFQDILILMLFIIPRVFLNIKEFKINYIKDYNSSRQGTLVIGGLGYIGSELVYDLLQTNQKVSVLDCAMYGDKVVKKFYSFPNFSFIKGYASDVILLGKLLKENSKVVHLAGLVGDPACALNERDSRYFNIKTTNIIKNLCFEYDVQRLIFASSCSVFGKTEELCFENSPTNPVSLYAKTKLDSEIELLESKIDTKILRFSTIFGPSERLRFDLVVNLFIAQAYYDKNITVFGGDQKRPFLHVKDAAISIKNFLNYKITNTQDIFNIGFDELNYTINEIAKLIEKNVLGSVISLSDINNDNRNYAVSFKKYKDLFPDIKCFSILDAIKQFNQLFKKNSINYKESIYSNLLTTKTFIDAKKNELTNLNKFN